MINLPDDAVVVRGGTLRESDLLNSAEKAHLQLKRPGLSVFAADVPGPLALVELLGNRMLHQVVCVTTLGTLRKLGFELEQTFDPPHFTVWLDAEDLMASIGLFRSAFSDPIRRSQLTN